MLALTKRNTTLGLNYFLPSTYGAIPGQNQPDQAAAFRLAIAAMPATGGVLFIDNEYTVNSEVVFDRPVTVRGNGGNMDYVNRTAPSRILCYSATANVFTVDHGGCTFQDLSIENWGTTTPTAGAGILVTNGRGLAPTDSITEYYGGFRMNNVAVTGFYDNISIINAYTWSMDGVYICRHVRYGVSIENRQLKDGGDANISNSFIFAGGRPSFAGVWQGSSGGLKMTNVKFNGSAAGSTAVMQYGYYGNLINGATSILIIHGCSFENISNAAILCHNFYLVTVSSCEFALYGTGVNAVIDFENVVNSTILGNTLQGVLNGSRTGIRVAGTGTTSYGALRTNCFQSFSGLKLDLSSGVTNAGITDVAVIDGSTTTTTAPPPATTNAVAPVGVNGGALPPGSSSYYVQYGTSLVNTSYSASGYQVTSALAATASIGWPASAKSTLAITKTTTPGLQGRIRSTGLSITGTNEGTFNAVYANNVNPDIDPYGLFFSATIGTGAVYVHEGPITGSSVNVAATGTVALEIDIYDTKVEYRVNNVLLKTTTVDPFANGPLAMKLFMRQVGPTSYFNNMIIEGVLVNTPF